MSKQYKSKENKIKKGASSNSKRGKGAFRGDKYEGKSNHSVTQGYIVSECEKGNDFTWYNKNGNLTTTGASYFLSNPAGKPIGLLNYDVNTETETQFNRAVPGIMTIDMLPSFAPTGTSDAGAATSGLNLAAKQLYANMRKANAGARSQYEAPDLLIYTLAVGNIYAFLSACARAYGFLSQYPTMNRYFAKTVIEEMGFDYDDLIENRLQFLNFINTSIIRLSRFVIPAGFSAINRAVWVNSNVFFDAVSTVKSQIYIPKYLGYWRFNAVGMKSGGCLEMAYVGSTPRTLASLQAFFESLVAPIAQDDDFLTISGDIMKFTTNYVTLSTIPMDYILNPIYDEDVMLQFHNLDYLPLDNPDSSTCWEVGDMGSFPTDLPFNSTYTIYQENGLLKFQPIINLEANPSISGKLLVYKEIHGQDGSILYIDTPEDAPSVERITEATRLITTYDTTTGSTESLPVDSCGAEIVVGISLREADTFVRLQNYGLIAYEGALDSMGALEALKSQIAMSPFQWDIRICHRINNGGVQLVRTHWNTRSIGTFDKESFLRLNDIITMSLLTLA